MSTTARKLRKRAGVRFTRAQKVGTPLEERSFVTQPLFRRVGDADPIGVTTQKPGLGPRSPLRIAAFLENGGRA